MVEIECSSARPGGVTLVAVRVDNRVNAPGVEAHRIGLQSRLDGPVWPPRVEGVSAAPWDGDTAELVVPTGTVGSLGFASPAEPPADAGVAPVELLDVEPADDSTKDGELRAADATADDVLRVLGDPSPPRDVVEGGAVSPAPNQGPADRSAAAQFGDTDAAGDGP